MLVRNEEFCEEWREGFSVVILLKNEARFLRLSLHTRPVMKRRR